MPAVRPFVAIRVAALSDRPLSIKTAGTVVRKNKDISNSFSFSLDAGQTDCNIMSMKIDSWLIYSARIKESVVLIGCC